jgi:hypothetical protein
MCFAPGINLRGGRAVLQEEEPQTDYEDLSTCGLDEAQRQDLLGHGGECVFSWTTTQGYPVGVVVAYIYRDGTFWTTCARHRKRVAALRKRPQSAVVVNREGRTASFKGMSVIHQTGEDGWADLASWFYGALSGTVLAPDDAAARSFHTLLDSPNRVIVETPAHLVVDFDGAKFGQITAAAVRAGLA